MRVRKMDPNSTDESGELASGRSSSRNASMVSYRWCPSAM